MLYSIQLITMKNTVNHLNSLNWRYATKKFDVEKKLSPDHITLLTESARLAPSSFGLQPYKLVDVVNPETRLQLQQKAYGQTQVTEASHFFVIAARTDLDENYINEYIQNIATTRQVSLESLEAFKQTMTGFLMRMTQEQRLIWAHRQAYIVLGYLLSVAAQNQIDSCPMEGFEVQAFDQILDLKIKNLTTSVCIALGYRDLNDSYASLKKVRQSKDKFILEIN